MNNKEYYTKHYLKDHNLYKKEGRICLCSRILSTISKKELKFVSLRDYLYCQYAINLINQVLYSHFNQDYDSWQTIIGNYTNCRCTYESAPERILKNAERILKDKMNFQKSDLLKWNIFFLDIIKDSIEKNLLKEITIEEFKNAIKNDPDCKTFFLVGML